MPNTITKNFWLPLTATVVGGVIVLAIGTILKDYPERWIKAGIILFLAVGLLGWFGYATYDTIRYRGAKAKVVGGAVILGLVAIFAYQALKIIAMQVEIK